MDLVKELASILKSDFRYWQKRTDPTIAAIRVQTGYYDWIANHLDLKESDILLDVGCGFGLFLRIVAPHIAVSFGLDIAKNRLKIAQKFLKKAGLPVLLTNAKKIRGLNSQQLLPHFVCLVEGNICNFIMTPVNKIVMSLFQAGLANLSENRETDIDFILTSAYANVFRMLADNSILVETFEVFSNAEIEKLKAMLKTDYIKSLNSLLSKISNRHKIVLEKIIVRPSPTFLKKANENRMYTEFKNYYNVMAILKKKRI